MAEKDSVTETSWSPPHSWVELAAANFMGLLLGCRKFLSTKSLLMRLTSAPVSMRAFIFSFVPSEKITTSGITSLEFLFMFRFCLRSLGRGLEGVRIERMEGFKGLEGLEELVGVGGLETSWNSPSTPVIMT